MNTSNEPLLQPFQLKHLTLRNRIISTSHAPSFAEDGHPRDQYRLYHEEKAKGGVALTMVGGSTNIAPDSPSVFGQLYAGDDSIIPWFQKLTSGVKKHGAAIMCQLTHMGRRTAWNDGHWLPVVGASSLRERAHRAFPKVAEVEDLARVINQFAAAAVRCKMGGFDGIEILAHSHLLGQFMSPDINDRDDAFGGSLANRLKLTVAVLSAVRNAVGNDFIVGIRLTGDELTDAGLAQTEGVEIAKKLEATGQVDFINVLAGAPYDDLGLAGWVSPMGMASAPHLSIAGQIREAVSIPVLHAGGIADLATARHALKDGLVDLVGMTRAQIADPYLLQKIRLGHEEQIRPCVGLGYCVDRVNQGKQAVCGHNAATGRETFLPHIINKAPEAKRTVVVGGGPGGLEAARVLALRGHQVHLFEASDKLGGQLNLASKSSVRRQVSGVVDWLAAEVERLGVLISLNTYVDAADIEAERPDLVIIATGGWPEPLDVDGGHLAITSFDVLGGSIQPKPKLMLFDEAGDQQAAVTALALAEKGCELNFVTQDRGFFENLGPTNSAVALKHLSEHALEFLLLQDILQIENADQKKIVTLRHTLTGRISTHEVDDVIVENGTKPIDDLYFELKANARNLGQLDHAALIAGKNPFQLLNPKGTYELARVGDAISSRNMHAAILDALRTCAFY